MKLPVSSALCLDKGACHRFGIFKFQHVQVTNSKNVRNLYVRNDVKLLQTETCLKSFSAAVVAQGFSFFFFFNGIKPFFRHQIRFILIILKYVFEVYSSVVK